MARLEPEAGLAKTVAEERTSLVVNPASGSKSPLLIESTAFNFPAKIAVNYTQYPYPAHNGKKKSSRASHRKPAASPARGEMVAQIFRAPSISWPHREMGGRPRE